MVTETESRFFRAVVTAVLAFRWPVLALILLMTVGAGAAIVTRLKIDNSTEYFASGDIDASNRLEAFRDDFGRDDLFFVLVEGDVFSAPFLADLRRLHTALEGADIEVASLGERKRDRRPELVTIPDPTRVQAPADDGFGDLGDFGDDEGWGDEEGGTLVEQVVSLVNFRQTVFEGGAIRVRGLLDDDPTDMAALRARVLGNPAMVGNIVGPDATHTLLAVRTQFMNEEDSSRVSRYFEALVAPFDRDGFRVSVTGLPALNTSLNDTVLRDTNRLTVLAGASMGVVLLFLFRRPLQSLAPLGVVGMAACWTLGFMALTGTPMTFLSSIVPVFLVCVGLGDSIHIQSVYRDLLRAGVERTEALVRAVASTGVPITVTSFTTMAGLASFRFATSPAIQEMGLAGAFGAFMALVNSVVFLPIVLSLEPARASEGQVEVTRRKRDAMDRFLDGCTALSADGRHWRVLAGGLLVAVISVVGMSRLGVYHNPLHWLGSEHPTTRAILTMDREVGGISSLHLVVEPRSELGIKDRDLLVALDELATRIRAYEHPRTGARIVTGTTSLVDVVKETNRALHEGDPDHYRIPDTQRGVSDALLLFESAGPDELSRLATGDLSRSHLTVRVVWMDASSYEPFIAWIEGQVDELLGDRARVSATGTIYSIVSIVHLLIGDLLRSFGAALVAITIMMIVLLRELRLGLVAMVPNLLPIGMVMGFMGFVGIPIDLANLIIASIIIGIAVDDTVHYLHQFKVGLRATDDVEQALHHALSHAGRAMVSTTAVLTLGFAVFLTSDLASIRRFGTLVAMASVLALLIDLILTPALLRALTRTRA